MCIKLAASKQYRFAAGAPQGNITCMQNVTCYFTKKNATE
jgi:hypothetical protein